MDWGWIRFSAGPLFVGRKHSDANVGFAQTLVFEHANRAICFAVLVLGIITNGYRKTPKDAGSSGITGRWTWTECCVNTLLYLEPQPPHL